MSRFYSIAARSLLVGLAVVTLPAAATAQVAIGAGLELRPLEGYTHEPLRGIDSIVGRVSKKDGLQVQYEIGGIPKVGEPRLGGSFSNYALAVPPVERAWHKVQVAGGRTVYVTYTTKNQLIVSSVGAVEGVNFNTLARTPADVADVLLIALSVRPAAAPRP